MIKAFEIKDLAKEFPEFKLGSLSLDLDPGTVLGYVGPNGSGKTTTMHCMVGLLKSDSGRIEIFGKKNDPNVADWKFDIGYVGDKHVFYENWNGERNLSFLSKFYPNWSDDYAQDLAKRFRVPLNKRAKDLSTGNRVKLSLIGALAHHPKLLILDEPTAGLDPVVRTEFLDVLFEVVETGERAIFYSTHILSDISRIADELAFLDDGKLKLRIAKDDLTDNWRKISFKLTENNVAFVKAIHTVREGSEYKIISTDYNSTLNQLKEVGAENIIETRMSVDEIAVEILKNNT
ncbi:ABC transporter ATP-binding protein [Bacteroidota bacterium]